LPRPSIAGTQLRPSTLVSVMTTFGFSASGFVCETTGAEEASFGVFASFAASSSFFEELPSGADVDGL
jgi:hypothetical protein